MKLPEVKYELEKIVYCKVKPLGHSKYEYFEVKIEGIILDKFGISYEVSGLPYSIKLRRLPEEDLWGTEDEMFMNIRQTMINWLCDKEDHIEKG